jgi:hypothetical protein
MQKEQLLINDYNSADAMHSYNFLTFGANVGVNAVLSSALTLKKFS